jgi:hypothetical protein
VLWYRQQLRWARNRASRIKHGQQQQLTHHGLVFLPGSGRREAVKPRAVSPA